MCTGRRQQKGDFMGPERRSQHRYPCSGNAYFSAMPGVLGQVGVAELVNISSGGLAWSTDLSLNPGDQVALSLDTPSFPPQLSVAGEVVWVDGDLSGVQLQPNREYVVAFASVARFQTGPQPISAINDGEPRD
jgi:hypothetical protein